jgi:hypothetical protein
MSEGGSEGNHREDFAPHDYTDGRKTGDWETRYPDKARKWIRIEAAYLILLSLLSFGGFLYILYGLTHRPECVPDSVSSNGPSFTICLGALACGVLGGCTFGVKWLIHGVAKQMWHEDRRLWRFLTPPFSGVVAMFMLFLIASDLLRIFDKELIQRPFAILAFSFLVGYCSDRAIGKMAELTDTLLGAVEKAESRRKK